MAAPSRRPPPAPHIQPRQRLHDVTDVDHHGVVPQGRKCASRRIYHILLVGCLVHLSNVWFFLPFSTSAAAVLLFCRKSSPQDPAYMPCPPWFCHVFAHVLHQFGPIIIDCSGAQQLTQHQVHPCPRVLLGCGVYVQPSPPGHGFDHLQNFTSSAEKLSMPA